MVGKYATETLAADKRGLVRAVARLRAGELVALPTETVYGLAARADAPAAVAAIFAAKGRPDFNPLIVHVASLDDAKRLAEFSPAAVQLAKDYWPGPLTLVVPRRTDADLADAVTAGLDTVAIRVPAHPVMRAVLNQTDFPLAAPSANRSGFISPTSADHVLASLDGRIHSVVDAGPCSRGVESTILAVRGDGTLDQLRPGPIDIGTCRNGGQVEAPGQLASHYAPGKPVRLNAQQAEPDEFYIGFGQYAGDCSLSASQDLKVAAASLYACLHAGAASDKPRIAVASVPDRGIGKAINDRLRRAAAPLD